ncbi:MAG: MBL fold metallo-hydrolase [Thioalkalivibrionaceae bacterium]
MTLDVVPVTAFEQNATLAVCHVSREAAWIDPGGEIERLLAATPDDVQVTAIWLTHGHLDHVGAASWLAAHFAVPILGPHIGDRFWFERLDEQARWMGWPAIEPFMPTRWLEDGEVLSLGSASFDVIHVPGHTPGHVAFVERRIRLAQVGDVLFNGSVGRSDLPGGDAATLMRSIHGRLLPLGDDIEFVPGHGARSTFGHERRHNPFLRHGPAG